MNKHVKRLVAASLAAWSFTAAAAELVVNGGFENPAVRTGAPYLVDVTPTGWTGAGDIAVQGYAGSVSSGQGNQWFDLNPGFDQGTGMSQALDLIAGTTYSFSFIYNGGGGGTTTQVAYSLASAAETLLTGFVVTGALNVYNGSPWGTIRPASRPWSVAWKR